MAFKDNTRFIEATIEGLAKRLPRGWRVKLLGKRGQPASDLAMDSAVAISVPGSLARSVIIRAKSRLEPKDVDILAAQPRPDRDAPVIVVAPFISPRTRQGLEAANINYADLTGNIRLALTKPALFIDARGAEENPEPATRERRSLKGPKAGRLVRALCDFRPPVGLRELATRADVDAGYASRIVQVLVRDALVIRTGRGPITNVDWAALLRRWSEEYSPLKTGRVNWYLAPRGLPSVVNALKELKDGYVVSGSWAANLFAPVTPARLLLCYADDVPKLAKKLDVRQVDAGMNVALVRPFDSVVTERTLKRDGLTVAAMSQVAADLLTSPGRGPSEAEALIKWMGENERVWRG